MIPLFTMILIRTGQDLDAEGSRCATLRLCDLRNQVRCTAIRAPIGMGMDLVVRAARREVLGHLEPLGRRIFRALWPRQVGEKESSECRPGSAVSRRGDAALDHPDFGSDRAGALRCIRFVSGCCRVALYATATVPKYTSTDRQFGHCTAT